MFKVNISIDDVSPHPRSSLEIIDQCNRIINIFPDAKFTLFVPAAYWRTMRPGVSTMHPLQLDLFPDFCQSLIDLPKENFEIGYHGFYHGIPGKTDNDEMRYLSYEDCIQMLNAIFEVIKRAGLEDTFSSILRPPAWRMSHSCFDACRDKGVKILALSPDKYDDGSLDYGDKADEFKNVVYYNVCPPYKKLELFPKTEMVYHACDWDKNHLNKKNTDDLISFLKPRKENIKFCFMEGLLDD